MQKNQSIKNAMANLVTLETNENEIVRDMPKNKSTQKYYGMKIGDDVPCDLDHNGECWICDCWISDCAWQRYLNKDYKWESKEELEEMFKERLATIASDKKIVLEGIVSSVCKCGKCNVSSHPGRIYIYEWSCKTKRWIKGENLLKNIIDQESKQR